MQKVDELRYKLKEELLQDKWSINNIELFITKIKAYEDFEKVLKETDKYKDDIDVIRNRLQALLYHKNLPPKCIDAFIDVSFEYLKYMKIKEGI